MHRPKVRLLRGLLLLMLLLQPFSVSGTRATPLAEPVVNHPHRVLIDSRDVATLRSTSQSNSELLADYGSFSLWRVSATTLQSLNGKSSVTVADDFDSIYLRAGAINTAKNTTPPVATTLRQARTAAPQLWLVQFVGPIQDQWLEQIEATGAKLVMYMPTNAYVVWADGRSITALDGFASSKKVVQWTGEYHPAYRLAPSILELVQDKKDGMTDVTVQFYTTDKTEESLEKLLGQSGPVYKGVRKVLEFTSITLQVSTTQLAALAQQADVFNIEPWSAPVKMDERQNQIIAGNVISQTNKVVPSGPGYLSWLSGLGFPTSPAEYPVVDVVDDGVDTGTTTPLHPDFYELGIRPGTSRISYAGNCTTDATGNGVGGHGNINVGIVGSYNNLTGSPHVDGPSSGIPGGYRIGLGVSPFTRLASTKIFRNAGPYDVSACGNTDQGVVNKSYLSGATLTSNSWGLASAAGAYDDSSQAYDALTRDASITTAGLQPMLHIFAAGNNGSGANTIGSPGTGKNVITVGANENTRDDGVADGCGASSNDNADDVVGFSSRGPTDDQRVKPDIMAPGSHIIGPASQDPGFNGNSVCNQFYPAGQTLYALSTGTSHSTPAVAGVASLLYTRYRLTVGAGTGPSPAMLKAYMLNSSRYLTGLNGLGNLPTNNQGWGSVYMKQAFDSTLKMFKDQTTTFGATGEEFTQVGQVTSGAQPFKVTLAWTDAPGSTTGASYVNDLNLEVTVGGQTYKGNVFTGSRSSTGGVADNKNNVEGVYLPAGTSGNFSVRVVAANVAGDGIPGNPDTTDQDFALVIYNGTSGPTGTLTGSVKHPTGTNIPGATVSAGGGLSALTNANGIYQMTLPVGTYAVTATIAGYNSQTVNNIVITQNVTRTQNFVLVGGKLQGQIRDAFTPSQPIAGATVTAGTQTTTSDANGNYVFERIQVGGQTINVSRIGYAPQTVTATIADDLTTTRNITLAGGAVAGIVTDSVNGNPIAGARIGTGVAPYVAFSDAAGRYSLRMPPASYTFSVGKVGYATANFPGTTVTSGITTTRNAALTPNFGYTPASLNKTLTFGQQITDTNLLQLINNSTSAFTVTIAEQAGGFTPLAQAPQAGTVLVVHRTSVASSAAAATALTNLGYTNVVTTNVAFESKTLAELQTYSAVVFVSTTGTVATNPSATKLMEYLDAGGRLLIADNDLGFFTGTSAFYTTYLDATYGGDEPAGGSNFPQAGEDILAGVNPGSNDPFPDFFTPKTNSTPIMRYTVDNSVSGSRITRGSYKAVYLSNDIQNYGTTTGGEPIETAVLGPVMTWLLGASTPQDNIAWLKEVPNVVGIPAGATRTSSIGWDTTKVAQPGTYTGTLLLNYTLVPTQTSRLPVTLVVNPSASQGEIQGTVRTSGICDTALAPLAGATVIITSSTGVTATVITDAAGQYSYFVQSGTYTVSASAPGQSTSSGSVTVPAGGAVTRDFTLRLQRSCLATTPGSLSANLVLGQQVTQTLTINSKGALPLDYAISEVPAGSISSPGADPYGYRWTTTTAQWIDATDGTSFNPLDDGEANVTLPFLFPYYGINTDLVRLSNNGAFALGTTTGDIGFDNLAMNAATTPNNLVAPFWDDFSSQTGAIYVKTVGTAPSRKVVIQWEDRPHYNGVGNATFQVILHENGNLVFQYEDVDFGNASFNGGAAATVGIRGANGLNSLQYSLNTASLQDGLAICLPRPGTVSCTDVPWLNASPATGTGLVGTPPSNQTVGVGFSTTGINQPGVYTATLLVTHNSPQPPIAIPVTLNVTIPANFGTLSGTVAGLLACDAPGQPLEGVAVRITGTVNLTVTTDVNGNYSFAVPSGSYSVTASAAGYVSQTATVTVAAQATTDRDFNLRTNAPCQNVSPTSFTSTQAPNTVVNRTLTVANTGAAPLTWAIQESDTANSAPTAQGPVTRRPVTQQPDAESLKATAPATDVIQDGGFEASVDPGTNPFWTQGSTNFGTVMCSVALCNGNNGATIPRTGTWFAWFGGQSAANPTEVGFISQSVTIPAGTASISFWLRIGGVITNPGNFIKLKIDGTEVWTVNSTATGFTNYAQVVVPLDAYANGAAHVVRFESTSLQGSVSNFMLDDVVLDSTAVVACSANALPWVTVTPASGTTAPGGSSAVTVSLNSTGMATGTYTGSLCYTSNDTSVPALTIPVTMIVSNAVAPISGLAVTSNTPVTLGATSLFTATVQSGTNIVYTWNFGDGTVNVGPANRSHTYAAAGTYTVTVTASNSANTVSQQTTMVVIANVRKIYLPLVMRN